MELQVPGSGGEGERACWARDIATLWAGPTWSPAALGLSPRPPSLGQGQGQLALGPGNPMGPSMPGSPCGKRTKGRGCHLSLESGSCGSGWGDTYLSALLSRLSRLPHVALGALQADNTKAVNQGREGQGGPPGTLSLASGRWKGKSQGESDLAAGPTDNGNATWRRPNIGPAAPEDPGLCQPGPVGSCFPEL